MEQQSAVLELREIIYSKENHPWRYSVLYRCYFSYQDFREGSRNGSVGGKNFRNYHSACYLAAIVR